MFFLQRGELCQICLGRPRAPELASSSTWLNGKLTYLGVSTNGDPQMVGLEWKIPLNWMILGYPHLRKLPCNCSCSWESFRTKWRLWTDTKDLKDVLREFRQQRLLFAMASKCFKSLRDIFPCPSPAPPHTPPHLASQPSQFWASGWDHRLVLAKNLWVITVLAYNYIIMRGFPNKTDTPIAGWLIRENPNLTWMI